MLWPKKDHTRNLITKKNTCGSKIPHPALSNGPSFSDGEVDLEADSFFSHPSPPKNIPLFSYDGVQLRDVCWTSDTIYYQTIERQVDELKKTLVSFFMRIVSRNPLERGELKIKILKMYCRGNRNVQCTVATAATLVSHRI